LSIWLQRSIGIFARETQPGIGNLRFDERPALAQKPLHSFHVRQITVKTDKTDPRRCTQIADRLDCRSFKPIWNNVNMLAAAEVLPVRLASNREHAESLFPEPFTTLQQTHANAGLQFLVQ